MKQPIYVYLPKIRVSQMVDLTIIIPHFRMTLHQYEFGKNCFENSISSYHNTRRPMDEHLFPKYNACQIEDGTYCQVQACWHGDQRLNQGTAFCNLHRKKKVPIEVLNGLLLEEDTWKERRNETRT